MLRLGSSFTCFTSLGELGGWNLLHLDETPSESGHAPIRGVRSRAEARDLSVLGSEALKRHGQRYGEFRCAVREEPLRLAKGVVGGGERHLLCGREWRLVVRGMHGQLLQVRNPVPEVLIL